MNFDPTSALGHGYIIVVIDYSMKWSETMSRYTKDGKIDAPFLFNHIITRFGVPRAIIIDHGFHFRN